MMENTGTIIRALSGFYDVDTGTEIIRCRARGKFRKEKITPLVGDRVRFQPSGSEGYLQEIFPRKNSFVRPAVANVDSLVMMAAQVNPVTEPFLIDRVAAIAAQQQVELILVLNKCDLDPAEELFSIYRDTGMTVLRLSAQTGQGVEDLRQAIQGKLVAFTGNSGVGKSSLLNALYPQANMATGEVSDKLGRGRHTTRHIELFALPDGTKIMDTPGFSAFDTDQMDLGTPEQLALAFPEFSPYLGKCRFDDCAHVKEKGCAVLEALAEGKIHPSRHSSYVRLYEKAKEIKAWERKKD
jgi:ribosome biogenesis GTPase